MVPVGVGEDMGVVDFLLEADTVVEAIEAVAGDMRHTEALQWLAAIEWTRKTKA